MDETSQRRTRKQARLSCSLPVVINDGQACTAFDISEGGLYVNTSQGMRQGGVVTVFMEHGGEGLTVKARVKHVQEGIGTGMMFIDLDDSLRRRIKKMIAGLQGSV